MRKNRLCWVALIFIVFTGFFLSRNAEALTLRGPDLLYNESGHSDCGLVLKAESDVMLLSVRYTNQGKADVIELLDSKGELLTSIAVPEGNSDILIDIDYPLTAGETYSLVSLTAENRKFAPFIDYPVSNSKLTVLSSIIDGAHNSSYWISFTDIKTGGVKKKLRQD